MPKARAKAGEQKAGNGRGSLDLLPSGRYRWRITVGLKPDGTPIRKSGTEATEKDAWAAMTQAQADHLRGGVAAPDRVTLSEWLDRWLEGKRSSLAVKTHHNYRKLIDLHIAPRLGRKRLQDVRPADLRALYTALGAAGLTDTQRQTHNILHGAFSEALRLELVMRDPTAVIRPQPVRRDAPQEEKALTAEEVAALLPALQASRWGLVFEFMLHTGLRRGEACGLKWAHVDIEAGTIRIIENLVTVGGKSQISTPKTAKSARRVHLSSEALDCLRRQQAVQDLERTALSPGQPVPGHEKGYERKRIWQDTGYVFTGISGVRLLPDKLKRYLEVFCKKARVRQVTVHGLRHTHASLMLRRGVPLEVVSQKLGHSRPSFTADVYRTVYQSEHEEWAIGLSDLLSGRKFSVN
ncbi:tyrosine-type recombinase/integrase [Deinococcus sp. Leaf326]|uniref:tyrosine-type recombinase/integrase n=1 Tax=Deinococcus sp. Leaf326 TaxID=1736338 RepID=UPI0006FF45A1|nr:tyrosine-type recombinase/integrase [Deinococcus sp. Leaf326]KQR15593.1 hypothetical protein ASF71_08115 [Deinococcus sp. Leaf326]